MFSSTIVRSSYCNPLHLHRLLAKIKQTKGRSPTKHGSYFSYFHSHISKFTEWFQCSLTMALFFFLFWVSQLGELERDLDRKDSPSVLWTGRSVQFGYQEKRGLCHIQIWFHSAALWPILLLRNLHHAENSSQSNLSMHSSMATPHAQLHV